MTSLFDSWYYILCYIIEALRMLVVTAKFTINKQLLSINIDYLEAMQIMFLSWYVRLFNLLIAEYRFKGPLRST